MSIVFRIIVSLILLTIFGAFAALYQSGETIALGEVAGHQFDNSDVAALGVQGVFSFSRFLRAWGFFIVVGALALIWWRPVWKWATTLAAMTLLVGFMAPHSAHAYYDKTDYAEVYLVLPNESAFWIPDTGANATTQTNMDSEAYFQANKIATKRFQIPHAVLPGSGWFSGYYVPTGRLIVVDRTPYNREWTRDSGRGTSAKDESFPCQTSEGINVTVEIGIASSVVEQNAAKFLYYFGVRAPQGDRKDPVVIFNSVYQGRSLAEVMDGVVRGKVSALVCAEIGARTLDKANGEINAIMAKVQDNVAAFLDTRGITLDYVGWAGTWSFDAPIQDAINRRYVSTQDKIVAETLQPYAQTIMTLAVADGIRTSVGKFDGKLPQTLSGLWLFPSNWIESIAGVAKAVTTPAAAPIAK
jgi:hypothetical protein